MAYNSHIRNKPTWLCQPSLSNLTPGDASMRQVLTTPSTSHTLTRSADSGGQGERMATWWSGVWLLVIRSVGWESMPTRQSMLLRLLLSCWSEVDTWPLTLYNSHIQTNSHDIRHSEPARHCHRPTGRRQES